MQADELLWIPLKRVAEGLDFVEDVLFCSHMVSMNTAQTFTPPLDI